MSLGGGQVKSSAADMGLKNMQMYIQKEGANKQAMFVAPEDSIQELKEEIIKRAHHMMPKRKHLVMAERKKIVLSLNGEPITIEESASLNDASIKEGDKVVFSFSEPLED